MLVSQSYGITRPAAIAARLVALSAQLAPFSPVPAPMAVLTVSVAVEAAKQSHEDYLESLRIERDILRHDLATMEACADDALYFGNGPTQEEIAEVEARLSDLDERLIFDDERPFIYGFDDLPAAYFTAQEVAQAA